MVLFLTVFRVVENIFAERVFVVLKARICNLSLIKIFLVYFEFDVLEVVLKKKRIRQHYYKLFLKIDGNLISIEDQNTCLPTIGH
jgi:hypothetical protein